MIYYGEQLIDVDDHECETVERSFLFNEFRLVGQTASELRVFAGVTAWTCPAHCRAVARRVRPTAQTVDVEQ